MSAHQNVLIMGRDRETDSVMPIAFNQGALDVYIQDQNSELINWLMYNELNDVELAVTTTVDSNEIELEAGHNVVVGNVIALLQNSKSYQGFVTNVAVNTITLDSPLDKQFRADRDYTAVRASANVAVDGSATRVIFHAFPPCGIKWDITQIGVYIIDDAKMDDTLLGGIPAVTNGIVLRESDGTYNNIGNIKSNGDFKLFGCDVVYKEKVAGGEDTMKAICRFSNDAGVTLRIDGDLDEELQVIVQDDLTGISSIYVTIIGHVVE